MGAINRAALNLEAAPWAFDGAVLRIASATTPGARYTVTIEGCRMATMPVFCSLTVRSP